MFLVKFLELVFWIQSYGLIKPNKKKKTFKSYSTLFQKCMKLGVANNKFSKY